MPASSVLVRTRRRTPRAVGGRHSSVGPIGPSAFGAALVLIILSGGCTAARLEAPAAADVANADDAHARMEFWAELGRRPVVSNGDALHALLLYLDGADPAADYP